MMGNQPNRKDAPHVNVRRSAPGEKPVLNEKWDFLDAVPLKEEIRRRGAEPPPVTLPPARPKPVSSKPAPLAKTGEEFSDDSKFRKGMRLYLTRRWEGALEEFLQIDAENFDKEQKAELAYYRGLCCTKLERFDDALMYLEQVIAIDNSPLRIYQCRMILAYIYIMIDHAPLAEAELSRLQGSGLESVMLYNTLAYSAYVQKHYLGAMEYYEKALEIDNDNTTALNSLGFILADAGFDKLKGLRLCRKAVDRNPENAAYLDSLGWASYKCGNIKDARKWLRQALDMAPQETEIKKHFQIVSGEAV